MTTSDLNGVSAYTVFSQRACSQRRVIRGTRCATLKNYVNPIFGGNSATLWRAASDGSQAEASAKNVTINIDTKLRRAKASAVRCRFRICVHPNTARKQYNCQLESPVSRRLCVKKEQPQSSYTVETEAATTNINNCYQITVSAVQRLRQDVEETHRKAESVG
ncbi:hypothetical protein EVAR_12217_1 [Eumeta japonica]|uniref:Uncharacterized protein n=1 Tax=Eumeta variegata TaxID=151549 RepID=A0A4C1UI23_EUMVA|nr:hypothetical protein EVAR_12217_1 [Eumeta japonica]